MSTNTGPVITPGSKPYSMCYVRLRSCHVVDFPGLNQTCCYIIISSVSRFSRLGMIRSNNL